MRVLLLLLAFFFVCHQCKDWNKINFDALEEEWKDGDDEEELETEYDRQKKVEERIKRSKPEIKFDPNDPASMARIASQGGGGGGGTMMFVDLVDEDTAGVPWTTVMQDKLCSRWAAMLQQGSLTAHVYNVSDKQLLVSTMKAWLMKDILKFVITQPEVKKATLDSRDHYPKDFVDEDEL